MYDGKKFPGSIEIRMLQLVNAAEPTIKRRRLSKRANEKKKPLKRFSPSSAWNVNFVRGAREERSSIFTKLNTYTKSQQIQLLIWFRLTLGLGFSYHPASTTSRAITNFEAERWREMKGNRRHNHVYILSQQATLPPTKKIMEERIEWKIIISKMENIYNNHTNLRVRRRWYTNEMYYLCF